MSEQNPYDQSSYPTTVSNPFGNPYEPLMPNMLPQNVQNTVTTIETKAVSGYLSFSGTAYDQRDKTANTAVQVSTTLAIISLAVAMAGPEAAPLALALDVASNVAGLVGYGMELHDALKSHNKKMETEAAIGIAASAIGMGADTGVMLKMGEHATGLFTKIGLKMSREISSYKKAVEGEKSEIKFLEKIKTDRMKKWKTELYHEGPYYDKHIEPLVGEIQFNKQLIKGQLKTIEKLEKNIHTKTITTLEKISVKSEKIVSFVAKKRAIVPFIENAIAHRRRK